MGEYEPEIGQACWGNAWSKFAMPNHAKALFSYLYDEMRRVYWNQSQREYSYLNGDEFALPGITFRRYWWGDDDAPQAALPNFVCDARPDVEIRFYKHPGRGLSCNVELTPDEWAAWFDACLAVIWEHDQIENLAAIYPRVKYGNGVLHRMAKALLHIESAARGQRQDAVQFHRGYRKGMADAVALFMDRKTANKLKAEAWELARDWGAEKTLKAERHA